MKSRLFAAATSGLVVIAAATSALAAAAPPPPPPAVANPRYVTLVLEETVNAPAAATWARIGKYCGGITEWFRVTCAITSGGGENDLGAVRLLNGSIIEMLVAKTDMSYTYTQPVRTGVAFNAYHGTLEVKPATATTSKIVYSFFYDNSMLADDAARTAEIANRRARFGTAIQNMKTLAEGGTMPPAPAPAR